MSTDMQCPGDGTCSNHGTCNITTGNCYCDSGFHGAVCSFEGKKSFFTHILCNIR